MSPDHIETQTCLQCGGTGEVKHREEGVWVIDNCPSCSGTGQTLY